MIDVAFLHIPKTAGTSILYAFRQGFGRDAVFTVSHDKNADVRPDEFPTAQISTSTRAVVGHVMHKDLLSNAAIRAAQPKIFSVIRDPFERLLSLFNYNHAIGVYGETQKSVDGLAKTIEQAPPNRQCEYLERDGASVQDVAANNFVCSLPNIETTLEKMFATFNLEAPRLHKINVTKDKTDWTLKAEDVPDSVRQKAYEINPRDYALYQSLIK